MVIRAWGLKINFCIPKVLRQSAYSEGKACNQSWLENTSFLRVMQAIAQVITQQSLSLLAGRKFMRAAK
jgi:hypothetical protein